MFATMSHPEPAHRFHASFPTALFEQRFYGSSFGLRGRAYFLKYSYGTIDGLGALLGDVVSIWPLPRCGDLMLTQLFWKIVCGRVLTCPFV